MQEYINMWKNFANFGGRTSRRGYWMAILVNVAVVLVLSLLANLLHLNILTSLYSLAVLVPGLAIMVRRLRDAGKHWGWLFISLVPLVGAIVLIVLLCGASVPAAYDAAPQV